MYLAGCPVGVDHNTTILSKQNPTLDDTWLTALARTQVLVQHCVLHKSLATLVHLRSSSIQASGMNELRVREADIPSMKHLFLDVPRGVCDKSKFALGLVWLLVSET